MNFEILGDVFFNHLIQPEVKIFITSVKIPVRSFDVAWKQDWNWERKQSYEIVEYHIYSIGNFFSLVDLKIFENQTTCSKDFQFLTHIFSNKEFSKEQTKEKSKF